MLWLLRTHYRYDGRTLLLCVIYLQEIVPKVFPKLIGRCKSDWVQTVWVIKLFVSHIYQRVALHSRFACITLILFMSFVLRFLHTPKTEGLTNFVAVTRSVTVEVNLPTVLPFFIQFSCNFLQLIHPDVNLCVSFLLYLFYIKQIATAAVAPSPAVITLPSGLLLFLVGIPVLHRLIKPIAPKTNSPVVASHLDEMRGPTQWRKFPMRLRECKTTPTEVVPSAGSRPNHQRGGTGCSAIN